jgi:hypothetical protein
MHDLNFSPKCPYSLTIAADSRLTPTDYINDHIWELNIGNSEPMSISLETTFGLRAKVCRIFPRFILAGQVVTNPLDFSRPITIHQYYPNFISITFKPFSTINVQLEYWVPGSQLVAGRSKISNTGQKKCLLQLEWAELLIPSEEGDRMSVDEIGMTTVLKGNTSGLFPVLYLTGGVQVGKSPYPSLNLSYEIEPHNSVESTWAQASLSETMESLELARILVNQNWQAEFAKIERVNSQDLEIKTGDSDWDRAVYFSQVLVNQLFVGSTENSGLETVVQSRNPDQGFSLVGDGSDYDHRWNGLTSHDLYYLSHLLLPGSPHRFTGILQRFFKAQSSSGEIDWKPGIRGQPSKLLCTPLLARLCLELFEYTGELSDLETLYPKLLKFFFSWFTEHNDRDKDGIPEWDQTIQTGYDENPYFSFTYPWSMGIDISCVESPDLASYLYDECQALNTIAKRFGDTATAIQLESVADNLKRMVVQSWSDQHIGYQYLDRDSHTNTPLVFLGSMLGEGVLDIQQEFSRPVRPFFYIRTNKEGTLPIQIYIHGTTSGGIHRVEKIPTQTIHWRQNSAYVTSESTFSYLEQIQVRGISKEIEVVVRAGLSRYLDQTLLLPLWAGIPTEEQAKILINLVIMNKNRFLNPYGLKSCTELQDTGDAPEGFSWVNLLFNSFILSGLIRYGDQKKAAELFTRIMNAVVMSLNTDLKLHRLYHGETGKPVGTANTLTSLVPISLFLKILGIKIVNSTKIEITGSNPFPWPVTIKFRGLTVVQHKDKALIIFPDGQTVTTDNKQAQIISLNN